MKVGNFFAELKRRNVYKVAVACAVVSWLVIQAASIFLPAFNAPQWAMQIVILILVVGFPIALVFSWAFEITPEGIKRESEVEADKSIAHRTGRKIVGLTVIVAAIAAGLMIFQLLHPKSSTPPPRLGEAATVPAKSIAVLPFENLSSDKENAYFADGIQDEILARLSKIADLKVISRTSTQKYKSAPDNLREIAQQLGVANILEGSVQKAADQVRITVQLINALKDDHLWADTYDRRMTDIFGVESDVAQKIAASLEAKLTGREKKEITFVGTKNPEAYDAVLHGLALRGSQHAEDTQKQLEFFQRAIDLDPNYPQAWAYLGAKEAEIYFFPDHTEARKEKARRAVETALHLAPELADTHASMGIYKYYCLQDYDGALTELNIARESAPNDGDIVFFAGLVQRRQGRVDDCIASLQQAAILDPLNQDILVNLGRTYRGIRRFDEARSLFDRALTIAPNDVAVLCMKAETYLAQGDVDTAWRMVNGLKISFLDSGFDKYVALLVVRREFDQAITSISSASTGQDLPPVFRAIALAGLANLHMAKGDPDGALPFREQAKRERDRQQIPPLAYAVFIEIEARFGEREAVERDVKSLFDLTSKDKWQFPGSEYSAAIGYALLGDLDRAIPLLQDALTKPSEESLTPSYLRLDPVWDSVRNDARFQKLVVGDGAATPTKP